MTEDDDLSFFAPASLGDLAIDMPTLSRKQDVFVKVFNGDIVEAMRFAGYVGTPDGLNKKGLELLRNEKVREALKKRGTYEESFRKAIATRDERLAFATALMRNTDPYGKVDEYGKDSSEKEIPLQIRMKALETLSKAHGDFSETINHNHTHTVSELVLKSFDKDMPSIEAIEAEYKRVREMQAITAPAGDLEGLI